MSDKMFRLGLAGKIHVPPLLRCTRERSTAAHNMFQLQEEHEQQQEDELP